MTCHFSVEELSCPCCGRCEMDSRVMTKLQRVREEFNIPMIVTSGFRCDAHNDKIGGAPLSQHLRGKAVDIALHGYTAREKHHLLALVVKAGFTGIGLYPDFIHLDVRALAPALWVGRGKELRHDA